ncbi:hypothetical protein Plec18167_008251 [Paecilomyces lecythidis]|uniref:ER-bound oxygenase mpaB/mpaB'/Rubber oxygenase catalytic domain-containing protein n=1 Tax=Paecilomyces lecythidis TaxID=3004212 RepID=A0ABR3WXC1_9EURO
MTSETQDATQKEILEKADEDSGSNPSTSSQLDLLEDLSKMKELPNILQEGILFMGGGVAILLQAAIPGAVKEPQESKDLAANLLNNIQTTTSYICCLTFGSKEQRKTLLDTINRGEHPLNGSDPIFRLWVVATLYATATDIYQRIYGRVDYRTAERVYKEYTLIVTALNIPSELWPKDRQKFWTYWDDTVENIRACPFKGLEKDLVLNFKRLPGWIRLMKPFLRVLTSEMLPPNVRKGYGLKSSTARRALYRVTMGFAVAIYPTFPKSIRSYPQRFYLKKIEATLGNSASA